MSVLIGFTTKRSALSDKVLELNLRIKPHEIPLGHDFNYEALGIEVAFSLPVKRVRSLDQIIT